MLGRGAVAVNHGVGDIRDRAGARQQRSSVVELFEKACKYHRASGALNGNDMETLLTKVQKLVALVLAFLLILVVVLSTEHLGFLIAEETWQPPRFLIPVQGLLEIFSFFLLVLIGVELLDTLKAYVKKDVIHVRVILVVALIAMARKVIVVEPSNLSGLTMVGIAALILALGAAFYFERQAPNEEPSSRRSE